jgi:hypothetical protein
MISTFRASLSPEENHMSNELEYARALAEEADRGSGDPGMSYYAAQTLAAIAHADAAQRQAAALERLADIADGFADDYLNSITLEAIAKKARLVNSARRDT